MRLTELSPVLKPEGLRFLCPKCRGHQIRIPINTIGTSWKAVGTLENLTVTPSINCVTPPCHWHGHIIDGEIRNA